MSAFATYLAMPDADQTAYRQAWRETEQAVREHMLARTQGNPVISDVLDAIEVARRTFLRLLGSQWSAHACARVALEETGRHYP